MIYKCDVFESLILQVIIVIKQKETFFLYSLFICALLCCFSIFWAFSKLCFYSFFFLIFLMSFYGARLNAKSFDISIQWLLTPIKQTVLLFNLLFMIFIFVV